ncbi:MAG: hypothetical protein JWM47_1547 [Acidimicrobiales bacterium]|nr:hypothetical protein [Acidimicrobiales bacterium]
MRCMTRSAMTLAGAATTLALLVGGLGGSAHAAASSATEVVNLPAAPAGAVDYRTRFDVNYIGSEILRDSAGLTNGQIVKGYFIGYLCGVKAHTLVPVKVRDDGLTRSFHATITVEPRDDPNAPRPGDSCFLQAQVPAGGNVSFEGLRPTSGFSYDSSTTRSTYTFSQVALTG